ncbi:glycosyltransferase family 2 protein [Carnobacterium divergens]|uniref:glycosyltransferase family 2 protein n=1 Tax=Carnobacterium divergens TaxID=2748 RepID=UPI00288FECB3|nr:glycosyltransferase family 2 protein [Carnobacterium divergens]MDT2011802.1 glycosyltransferase family 2 protein [Carnobacterium divergens]
MISVCMATYNGEKFIERQLSSILPQLSESDEVIIVDDSSKDNTIKLVEEMQKKDNRIKLIPNNPNLGVLKSFNKAMNLAQGDILFLCDQDDYWYENKVATVMKIFNEDPTVYLVSHDAEVKDNNLNLIDDSWDHYNTNKKTNSIVKTIIKNGYTGCMMAFRKELRDDTVDFPKKIQMHDQWLALVAMKNNYKIVNLENKLMAYIRHGDNVTGARRPVGEMIQGRINMATCILNYNKRMTKEKA